MQAAATHEAEAENESTERRPATRGDCVDGQRPCPWVGCRYHLAVDVGQRGTLFAIGRSSLSLRASRSDAEWWTDGVADTVAALADTCCLDVADRGGITLQAVADTLGVTRERVRQIETNVMDRLRRREVR